MRLLGQEVLYFLTLEDGIDILYRNVCKELLLYAASHHRRAQVSDRSLSSAAYVRLDGQQILQLIGNTKIVGYILRRCCAL